MNEAYISLRNVNKHYGEKEGAVQALSDISFDVNKGEFLCILGNSGSGKSTVLNILGGIDRADNGKVFVDGKNILSMSEPVLCEYRKKKVGFVFQSFNLIKELTAIENVAFCADDKEKIREALEKVGMWEKRDKYPSMLSGGEQQRVSIARALVKNPDILLCDEPTGALDYETGRKILMELEKIRKEGKIIIMATHTREIGKMADRVIYLKNGRIDREQVNSTVLEAKEIEW